MTLKIAPEISFRLKDLFSEGVIVGGQVNVKTKFFDKPGEHHVGALWKHIDLPDLSFSPPAPEYPYPPPVPGVPTIKDSYTLYYGFDQYLKVYPWRASECRPGETTARYGAVWTGVD